MTIDEVKEDYVKELTMLQSWWERMGADPGDPLKYLSESAMSAEYKAGWRVFLQATMDISNRMIGLCNAKDKAALIGTLTDEAGKYRQLAGQAATKGLNELEVMLNWEATSREGVADSLKGPSQQ